MNNNISFFKLLGIIFICLLFLYLIKVFDLSYPLNIVTTSRTSELAVVGEGKIEVVPDIAQVQAGITVNDVATVDEAQKSINKTNNTIIEAMKRLGIKKDSIKTSNYSISPNYNYERKTNNITGYNGSVTITIKIIDTQLVPRVIEEATKAGANEIRGVNFSIEKPEDYREKARDVAIKNAKEQAEKLAKKLGIRLGKVVNIVESSPDNYTPLYKSLPTAVGMGGAAEASIEPGSQTITSTVTLYFEKK